MLFRPSEKTNSEMDLNCWELEVFAFELSGDMCLAGGIG